MDRLTEKRDGQNVIPLRQDGKNIWSLTVVGMGDAPTHFLYGAYADKLAEYEDLEEQGLLLRLPCKNWMDIVFGEQETFFGIDESYIENPIREITVDSADRFTWYDGWKTLVLNGADENGLDWEFSPEDIGKTVFLTKAEAEQKLKEMESD